MTTHSEGAEVLRDRLEAAWCPGSGFLIDAQALNSVQGFPETSIAEDVLFSWILQGNGYRIIYVNENLQWGLQPNSLASHIGQRTKWVCHSRRNAHQCLNANVAASVSDISTILVNFVAASGNLELQGWDGSSGSQHFCTACSLGLHFSSLPLG